MTILDCVVWVCFFLVWWVVAVFLFHCWSASSSCTSWVLFSRLVIHSGTSYSSFIIVLLFFVSSRGLGFRMLVFRHNGFVVIGVLVDILLCCVVLVLWSCSVHLVSLNCDVCFIYFGITMYYDSLNSHNESVVTCR